MVRILIAIVAVIVGLFVGMISNMLLGLLNVQFFPMPESMTYSEMFDPANEQAIIDWIGTLPQTAFVIVLFAHLSQAFMGGVVAALIAKRNMMCVALIVGSISLIGGIMNMSILPLPVWMWIEMPFYILVAYWAAKIVMKWRVCDTN
ncbi:MAG: hypothetical protein ACI9JK_001249 [Phycisphaerales bacterium]|jgi:hypothetical protein